MKKLTGCQYEQKVRGGATGDKNLEIHIAGCPECQESQKISDWMQKFAVQTPKPQNLPAPGFLMFKSRLIEKQSAVKRAVQPIVWAQIISALIVVLGIVYLQIKSEMPIGEILSQTFALLSSIAPLFIFSLISAALICFAFAYFLRETKGLKK